MTIIEIIIIIISAIIGTIEIWLMFSVVAGDIADTICDKHYDKYHNFNTRWYDIAQFFKKFVP